MKKPPDLIIVGAHKAGTTWLHSLLNTHPQIEMSFPKEPHYLVRHSCQSRLHTGVFSSDDYYSLWNHASKESLTGEASVLYLPYAAEAIKTIEDEFCRSPRIIICLRDPISRARSAFLDESLKNPQEVESLFSDAIERELRRGPKKLDGHESPTLRYIALSHYAEGVRAFQRAFGVEHVHIVESQELFCDPELVMKRLYAFLSVSWDDSWRGVSAQNVGQIQWSSRIVRRIMKAGPAVATRRAVKGGFPALHAKARDASVNQLTGPVEKIDPTLHSRLRALFSDDVAEIQELVTCDLSHWLAE